jgi:hypothetical protein
LLVVSPQNLEEIFAASTNRFAFESLSCSIGAVFERCLERIAFPPLLNFALQSPASL